MTTQTQFADLTGGNLVALANLVIHTFRTKNSLVSSGVAVTGPDVELMMSGGGVIQQLNWINKVDTSSFNYSSDDYDTKGATGKLGATPYNALRHDVNFGWTTTDLVKIITKYDPTKGATSAIPLYWSEVAENMAVASLKGCLAKSGANLTTGVNTDAFDFNNIIDVAATMDDPRAKKTLFTSRKTFAKLQKANYASGAGLQLTDKDLNLYDFAGYGVIVTEAFGDNMTVVAQEGAIAFAAGNTPGLVPMELERDANAGNGGGGEILHSRLSITAAPQGFSYAGAAKPGITTLANSASWTLAETDTTRIGFRAIKHAA